LYFGGQSISLIGTWMTRLATSWLVYRLTGSAFLLGIVGFAGQIPTFIFAPFAGVWIDRLDRRQVLLVTQILAMAQSLALAFLTLARHINIHEIVWLSAFQGLINAFDMPARQAFLVQMVEDKQDLGNAIALNSSMVNLARLVGPSLAGGVIAVSGEGACFLIDGISYIAVIASLAAMRLEPGIVKATTDSMIGQLKEGWAYVSGFAPVRTILLLFAMVSLMGWPFTVLMPIFAGKILKGGPHTLGFLMGAIGIGALVSAISLALRKTVLGLGRMIPIATASLGVGLILFGMSRILWVSLILMLFCGFGMMQQMAASNTIIQTIVDDNKRGRVMSFYSMAFVGMAPFGSLLAGGMAHAVGAPLTVILNGVCCVAGAIWFATRLKAIRKLIRPIYIDLGILPAVSAAIQDGVGT
jgi:MFS family permease